MIVIVIAYPSIIEILTYIIHVLYFSLSQTPLETDSFTIAITFPLHYVQQNFKFVVIQFTGEFKFRSSAAWLYKPYQLGLEHELRANGAPPF